MTDLELIIKELEERIESFRIKAKQGQGEPDGQYASRDISALKHQLRILKLFDPDYKKILEAEEKEIKIKRKVSSLAKALERKLYWLSEKSLSLEEYEDKLTKIIKNHMRQLQALTATYPPELEVPSSFDIATENKTRSNKHLRQDKVYELTEAVYDGHLYNFEVRILEKCTIKFPGFLLSRDENIITIELSPKASRFHYGHQPFVNRNAILTKLGYTEYEERWCYRFYIDKDYFDKLITVVARTLIDVFQAIDKVIEIIYEEYKI